MNSSNSAIIRWATLIVVIFNVAFNYFYTTLSGHPTMGEISFKYPSLFTPPGYTFSIWGIIYLSFIVYCIIQLQGSKLDKKIYNQLSVPLLLANIFAAIWIWVYTSELLAASVVIILFMLFLSIEMFISSGNKSKQPKYNWWLQVPFSMFFGWLSVAFLANLSVLIASIQGKENASLTIGFIILAGLAAVLISLRSLNPVYPAVISWATFAMWTGKRSDHPLIANVALTAAIISILMVLIAFMRLAKLKRQRY